MNLLVTRNPTRLGWSDSCPYGLGGFTLSGRAWRLRISDLWPFHGDDTANNVLEFLGMAITILLLLEEAKDEKEDFPCIMALGDNTSAISWIFRSSRIRKNSTYYPVVKHIARTIATRSMEARAKICSQHIAGKKNAVADILSFAGDARGYTNPLTHDDPPNDILTKRIHFSFPQIIPSGFKISQLPREIESFALSVMRIMSKSWNHAGKLQTRRLTDNGDAGQASCRTAEYEAMTNSTRYQETARDCSWQEASLSPLEAQNSISRVELLANVRDQWYQRLFAMPLAAWH